MNRSILAVGLPGTGKTTFLAAFWNVVCSGDVDGAFVLESLTGDRHYLNDIRDRWADCLPLARTRAVDECVLSMSLRDNGSGQSITLSFPDLAGESLERQWLDRAWTAEFDELVAASTGVLLFIHPLKVKEAALICEADKLAGKVAAVSTKVSVGDGSLANKTPQVSPSSTTVAVEAPSSDVLPALPDFASTQVQLIDLLQFQSARKKGSPRRVAVIISAWDLVKKTGKQTPQEWLTSRLPMLDQYLRAHSQTEPYMLFGVSAQGGDLKHPAAMRKKLRSSERILVESSCDGDVHDVTFPVRWVTEGA